MQQELPNTDGSWCRLDPTTEIVVIMSYCHVHVNKPLSFGMIVHIIHKVDICQLVQLCIVSDNSNHTIGHDANDQEATREKPTTE